MDLIELEFLELQSPLFLNGINFGLKFPGSKIASGQLDMFLDENHSRVLVTFKGKVALIPCANVVTKTPKDCSPYLEAIANAKMKTKAPALTQAVSAPLPARGPGRPRATAQVSTPTSHVFAPKA